MKIHTILAHPIIQNMEDTHIVIMAGGIGSRLWPISTAERPKQFMDVLGVGKSLIRLTFERFRPLALSGNFWVVTADQYIGTVKEELPEIPDDHILAEPEPRNTAPCIAYACRKIRKRFPSANVVVTPADGLILEAGKFRAMVSAALERTRESSDIVTIGIKPVRPETGYGYICADGSGEGLAKVSSFKEKPSLQIAEEYLRAGNYFWNAGIFIWNVRTADEALRTYAPQIAGIMDILEPTFYTDNEKDSLRRYFGQCEKISIDYAVMEKSPDIYVISEDIGWSDLGTWSSVKSHIGQDQEGNSSVGGDIRLFGCKNCIVHASSARTVIVQGLEDYIVSENEGKILICSIGEEQHIREYSEKR